MNGTLRLAGRRYRFLFLVLLLEGLAPQILSADVVHLTNGRSMEGVVREEFERLAWDEGSGQVLCRSRPVRRRGLLPAETRWDVLELLVRVVDPIPEPSQQTVRYWGFSANAARGKRR